MKKYAVSLSVLLACTVLSVALQKGLSGMAEASRGRLAEEAPLKGDPDRLHKEERATRHPGALTPANFEVSPGDAAGLLLARLAHDSGCYLLEQARKADNSPALLGQAAAHLRASLAHESTAREPGSLFRDARGKLDEVERLLASAARAKPEEKVAPAPAPAAEKPKAEPTLEVAPKAAAPAPAPEEARKPAEPELEPEPVMVGPDGVIFQRVRE